MALQGISEDQHARLLARRIGEEPAVARRSAIPRQAAKRATVGNPFVGGAPDPNLDNDVGGGEPRSNITFLQYIQHTIQARMALDGALSNLILYGKNLFQEFLVTCQATSEDMRLNWVRELSGPATTKEFRYVFFTHLNTIYI